MPESITIALAGNPNSGKTTIFNNLTGAHQHVGNYPGVTVEKKEGVCHHGGVRIHVVDLPGTYSLTAYSIEEVVARDFILESRPDVVVDVADASNLERNLYLTTQLLQLRVPLVLALNMSDMAERRGFAIDRQRLGELLGARVVATVGHKGRGMEELLDAIVAMAQGCDAPAPVEMTYGREIDEELDKLTPLAAAEPALAARYGPRWLAVKLLEDDSVARQRVEALATAPETLLAAAAASRRHIHTVFGDSPELVIADRRYGCISGACQEAVVRTVEARHSMSDRIDSVVMHRALGIPLFLLLTYLVFQFTFALGDAPTGWIESLFGWMSQAVAGLWPKAAASPIRSLLVDGVIGGVGGVLTFAPYIMLLFLAIAMLEDTGYMARAAFLMDRVMHHIGLHGKSFIPMLIGFGCNVPAIMATRTLDTRRDRLATIMVLPLMSCSARLVIYTVITAAFFPNTALFHVGFVEVRLQPLIVFSLYFLGVLLAIAGAKLLRGTVLRGEATPLVIELPPYRVPTVRGLLIHMWERSRLYVKKAGTVILGISIVLWVLTSYPKKQGDDPAYAARRTGAEAAYVEGVGGLAEPLGVAGQSDALVHLARAELELAAAADRYWPREAGYRQAQARYDAELAALRASPAGGRIERFLGMRDDVAAVRRQLEGELQRLGATEHSPERLALVHHFEKDLGALGQADPAAYAAAVAWLDSVRPALDGELAAIQGRRAAEGLAWSLAGRIGKAMEPAIRPLGFDWRIGTALLGAFGAREVFVAQMSILYAVGAGEEHTAALRERLRADYTPLVGVSIMLFTLVSLLCMPTVAVTYRETGNWRWPVGQFVGLTALAYVLTLATYQVGTLLGLGG